MSSSPAFGFHPKCKNLNITHLAYADDLLLFSRGDVRSVSMIMNCLNRFVDMAGLRINLQKIEYIFILCGDCVRQEILNVTGVDSGVLPFRYLGIPLASTKLRSSYYSSLVDAIRLKISSWPRQSLSYAGKVELIRSVVQGVECFWLAILPVPSNIIDKIYAICRNFIWETKRPRLELGL